MEKSEPETAINKKEDSNRKDYKKQARNVIWITLGFLTVAIVIIVRIQVCIGITSLGQLGGAIGGITAPIVGVGGAWLVYLSFLIQHQANEDLKERQDNLEKKNQQKENFNQLQKLIETIIERKEEFNKVFESFEKDEENYDSLGGISSGILTKIRKKEGAEKYPEVDTLVAKLLIIKGKLYYLSFFLRTLVNTDLQENHKQFLYYQFDAFEKDYLLEHNINLTIEALTLLGKNREFVSKFFRKPLDSLLGFYSNLEKNYSKYRDELRSYRTL